MVATVPRKVGAMARATSVAVVPRSRTTVWPSCRRPAARRPMVSFSARCRSWRSSTCGSPIAADGDAAPPRTRRSWPRWSRTRMSRRIVSGETHSWRARSSVLATCRLVTSPRIRACRSVASMTGSARSCWLLTEHDLILGDEWALVQRARVTGLSRCQEYARPGVPRCWRQRRPWRGRRRPPPGCRPSHFSSCRLRLEA